MPPHGEGKSQGEIIIMTNTNVTRNAARVCEKCGKELSTANFSPSCSIVDPSGFLPICNDCLGLEFKDYREKNGGDNSTSWNFMNAICQAADIKFIPEKWTKLYPVMGDKAPAQYLKLLREVGNYDRLDWSEQETKWRDIINQKKEEEIHPVFSEKQRDELKIKWGDHYTEGDREKLESMYHGIVVSYGVGDEIGEDNARKLCMLSLEIDKCIASGGAGLDKLITPYNKIQSNAGFVADNTRDINSFESISELMLYMEKTGWKEKFINDVPRDIVDMTIKDIQAHNTRLYKSESTMSDQVDEKIEGKRRIEELEEKIRNEEIDEHFDEIWEAKGIEENKDEYDDDIKEESFNA